MSSALAELYVLLSVNTEQLLAGFTQASAAGEEFSARMTATMDAAGASSAGAARAEAGLADAARSVTDAAAAQASAMGTLASSATAAGDAARTAAAGQGDLAAGEKAAGDAAATTAAKTDAAGAAAGRARHRMGLLALGVAAGGVAAVKMAGDVQQATTRLVTSAGESQRNLAMITQGLLGLSVSTATSTSQLSAGLYTIESAGYHGAAGLAVLKAAAQGAKAEGADLATVGNAVTSAMNAYHLPAAQAVAVTDQLVAAVGRGKMTMQDLAGSIAQVLPVAARAHLSLAQVSGAIATMTSQGMSADQSAQDLRHTIMSLQNPSSVQVAEMQQLGINSNDLAKNLGKAGLTGTIEQLQVAIMHHMGRSGEVMLSAFNKSKAAAQDAQVMLGKLPASVQAMGRSFLTGTISYQQWYSQIKQLPPLQRNLAMQFATTAQSAHGFNSLLKSGSPDAQTYTAALSKVLGGTTGLTTALMVSGPHMATFKGNVAAIGTAADRAGKNVAGWPLIQKTFNFQLTAAGNAAKAMATSLGLTLLPAATAAMHAVASFGQMLARNSAASKAFAAVAGVVVAGALEHKLVKGLKTSAEGLRDLTKPITGVIGLFRKGEDGASQFGRGMTRLRGIASTASSGVQAAWSGATTLFSAAKTGITAAAAAIRDWSVWSKIAAAGAKIWAGAQAALDVVLDANPIGLIVVAIAALVAAFVLVWTHCKAFRDFWKAVWHDIQAAAEAAWHFIDKNLIQPLMHGVGKLVAWVRQHWHTLAGILGVIMNPIGALVSFVHTHWHQITQLTGRLVGDVVSFFRRLPGRILAELRALPGQLLAVGRNIVMGLVHGIEHAASAAVGAIRSVGSGIVSGIKGLLGIASPSTVMRDVGLQISAGLIQGLEGTAGQVRSAAGKLATDVRDAVSAGMISTSAGNSLTKWLTADNTRLQTLATQRSAILATIKRAQSYAASVTSSTEQAFGLSQITGAGPVTSQSVLASLRLDVGQIKAFQSNIAKLAKMGLNRTLLDQIIKAGPIQGAQVAQALANGPAANIKAISAAESQITSASTALGNTAANAMYDHGANVGRGFMRGLQSQQRGIEHVMRRIADAMVSQVKHDLGIASPSTVMQAHGKAVTDGLIAGMDSGLAGVRSAAARLSAATTPGAVPVAVGAAGAAAAAGGGARHLSFHLTVQGFVGDEQQLVRKLYPALQEFALEVDRRNPVTGNGLARAV